MATRDRAAAAVAAAAVAVGPLPRRACAGCRRWSRTAGPTRRATRSARSRPLPPAPALTRCGWPSPRRSCSSWWPRSRSRWSRSASGCGWRPARSTSGPRSSCCCSRRRPTGRCAGSGAEFHAAAEGARRVRRRCTWRSTDRPAPGVVVTHDDAGRHLLDRRHPRLAAARPVVAGLSATLRHRASPRSPGRRAAASRPCWRRSPASWRPTSGRSAVGDDDLTGVDPDDWRASRRLVAAAAVADRRHRRRQRARSAEPAATDAEACGARSNGRPRRTSCSPSPTAWTPRSARTAPGSPPASGPGSRWPGCWSADRPVVLLDEPTAHLDAETEEVLLARRVGELARDADRGRGRPPAGAGRARRPRAHPVGAARSRSPRSRGRPAARRRWRRPRTTGPAPREPTSAAIALGALSAASGVALTATAGWLITRAATQPPVLT